MVWYILAVVVFIWMLNSRRQRRHFDKLSKQLKSDVMSLPVIGHSYLALGDSEAKMDAVQRFGREAVNKGGLTCCWLANTFAVVVADPNYIDIISKACLEKHFVLRFLTFLGNGSLVAPVSFWRSRRKIVVSIFNQKNLNQFVNKIFSQQTSIMVERLREVDGKGTISIWKYVNMYTLDTVCEAVLGVQMKAQQRSNNPFLKALEICLRLATNRMCQPWYFNSAIYKLNPSSWLYENNSQYMCSFVDEVIKSKRKQMKEEQEEKTAQDCNNNIAGNDHDRLKPLLERLILESAEGKHSLSDLEFREEMLVLLLAGTDTSAVAASFIAVMLSRRPDIQAKVYKELQEVFGDSERPIDAQDLPQLKYLEAVIKETLRLYPPVPVVIRQVEEDIPLSSGITLVKGVGACLHIWAVHRNPEYWGEDAEEFKPERFLDTPLKHPAAFMPFSFGPRNCPGNKYAMMSLKTTMSSILRRYQILPDLPSDGSLSLSDLKDKPLRLKIELLMRDVNEFKVQLKSRM